MRWLKRGLLALLALLAIALTLIVATGNVPTARLLYDFATGAPDEPFDPGDAVPPPDYADEHNWAALPSRQDLADLVPAGVERGVAQGQAPVDVFFIHPTGFLKGSSWTFSMDADTSTEENTRWMIANQASPYNGCCNVYAPRYRQASIYTYFAADEATREAVLGFAYTDVERAFDYFLAHYNQGRPFILASHSQGTHHGIRLLREKIDGTPLAARMVAAYLIGGGLETAQFDDLQDIALCDAPRQLHCAVHWDTWSEAVREDQDPLPNVCTNPLTWRLDGPRAGREQHVGAVPDSGEYHVELSGDDAARDVIFAPHDAPLPKHVEAECAGGRLFVSDQSATPFGERGIAGNYHGLDYTLFYMDIRENAQLRVDAYLQEASP
ncbi:MAG: hypothetical protein CME59_18860 [Halioglobus sp.]|nr:hypothetical protein [Halioglobus sp.]|tara:strand:- start:391 stop:1536 length:1146 start_codon:yes stop_codon:yes gene_type:complete